MTRHTSNRHNKKNSVTTSLSVQQENHSRYPSLHYWMTVMVGLLSLGVLLQRFRGAMPAHAASVSSPAVTLSHDNGHPSYAIQCPGVAPLLLSSAVTYRTGNSVVGLLSSLPLWFARPVAAQTPGVSIVVPEFRVNSNVTGTHVTPTVASLSYGEWLVVWEGSQTGDTDIYGQRYAANGSVLGSEFRVNSATTGYQYSPAVAGLSTGEWVVVWHGGRTGDSDIYSQRYALSGSVVGSEFRVNSATAGQQQYPALSSLSAGGWVVVWYGAPTGDNDIYGQRYALNGSMLGSEFRVNSNLTGNQWGPAVASLSAGEWVVVWQGFQAGNWDIYAQRYALNGSVLGSEFRVNSNVTGHQSDPAVSSLSSGEWVVAWQGNQGQDGYDIYAQRYALNGSVLGSEFRVNSAITGAQYVPAVASTSAGEWMVVWTGDQTGDADIYMQWYAMSGSVLGSEFRVNSATAGTQRYPKVSSLSSGEWVVVWEGYQTGGGNIYGSIFSSVAPLSTTASSTPSSSITTSILSTTAKSPVTTLASSTLSTSLSTTTNDNSVKTLATTTSLNPFTSPSSAGVSAMVATATNQPSTTPPQTTATNANSGVSGVIIGAAVGGSVVGVAACLGVIGFYAYRKKSSALQATHSVANEAVGTSLKTMGQASAQPASEYAQVNLKEANQSDNMIPVSNSPYGRIDEIKKQEKEYDHAPSF